MVKIAVAISWSGVSPRTVARLPDLAAPAPWKGQGQGDYAAFLAANSASRLRESAISQA